MNRHPFSALLASFCAIAALSIVPAQAATGWPQLGYDGGHGGYNPKETVINSGNVATLTRIVTLSTPGQISDPVMVSNGITYANSIGSNALYAFDVTSGQQLWTFSGTNLDAQRGIAVSGGRVFVTCAIDSQHAGLCALNAKTGKLLWSWAYEGNPSSPQSPPAVLGSVVYFEEFQTYGDWLTALDVKTGAVLWQFGYCDVSGVCDAMGPNPPAIDGGMVYVGCSLVSGFQGVCAVNASTGAEAWATQLGGQACGTSYCWGDASGNLMAQNGVIYANYMTLTCNSCSYTIDAVALNESTGASVWDTPMTQTLNGQYSESIAGPPAIHGKHVFSVLQCCDANSDSGLVSLNAKTGQVQYHAENSAWLSSSPSLVNDLAFVACSHGDATGTLCAFHATDGSYLWNSPIREFQDRRRLRLQAASRMKSAAITTCASTRRNSGALPRSYRFENWKLRRAFGWPYFLRSTTRGSRVRKPPCFSTGLSPLS